MISFVVISTTISNGILNSNRSLVCPWLLVYSVNWSCIAATRSANSSSSIHCWWSTPWSKLKGEKRMIEEQIRENNFDKEGIRMHKKHTTRQPWFWVLNVYRSSGFRSSHSIMYSTNCQTSLQHFNTAWFARWSSWPKVLPESRKPMAMRGPTVTPSTHFVQYCCLQRKNHKLAQIHLCSKNNLLTWIHTQPVQTLPISSICVGPAGNFGYTDRSCADLHCHRAYDRLEATSSCTDLHMQVQWLGNRGRVNNVTYWVRLCPSTFQVYRCWFSP